MESKLTCSFCPDKLKNLKELINHFSEFHGSNLTMKNYPCKTNKSEKIYRNLEDFKKRVIKIHNLTDSE